MAQLKLTTLTPLWTGGADGTVDRLHETGLLGSLRWWYEALVRGVGGHVCDGGTCTYDSTKPNDGLCDVCRVFGATGWRRRFRLTVDGGEYLFGDDQKRRINIVAPGGHRGWYFGNPRISTSNHPITFTIHTLRPDADDVVNNLHLLLLLISHWGAFGAKTQHGHGVIQNDLPCEEPSPHLLDFNNLVRSTTRSASTNDALPSLENMFFSVAYLHSEAQDTWWKDAELGQMKESLSKNQIISGSFTLQRFVEAWRLDKGFSVPIAPAVRYKLRYGNSGSSVLKSANDEFFGYVRGMQRKATMLHISNAYKKEGQWQFRIWGWLPASTSRDALLNELCTIATSNAGFWDGIFGAHAVDVKKTVWREFNSPRDTVHPNQTNMPAFLRSLMQIEEPQP
ncbi:MAG: type III-B CRISPR module RAMP protein Cmr1 [Chloroflexaceae bacterium]|nr:type III-B CRISPR module RAMP protein Cmr1 [Chloroflexaceae bacterium]